MPTSYILSSKIFFAKEASVLNNVTVSRENLPPTSPNPWPSLGEVESFSVENASQVEELTRAKNGRYMLYDVLTTLYAATLRFSLHSVSRDIFEMAFVSSKNIMGSYVPLSGDGLLKGYLLVEQHDSSNTLRNQAILFVALRLADNFVIEQHVPRARLEASVLYSTNNSGTLKIS